jgi:hypothetical protein
LVQTARRDPQRDFQRDLLATDVSHQVIAEMAARRFQLGDRSIQLFDDELDIGSIASAPHGSTVVKSQHERDQASGFVALLRAVNVGGTSKARSVDLQSVGRSRRVPGGAARAAVRISRFPHRQ